MAKIAVLGTGSWATALSRVLVNNNHEVMMYGINQHQIDDININHQNSEFFKGVTFEKEIVATNCLQETISDASYILITIPTQFVRATLEKIKPLLKEKITIVNASKGFDMDTNMRMSDTIRSVFESSQINSVVSLIGPSHAEEVVVQMLTTVCAVSVDLEVAKDVQHLFSNNYFRVYAMNDEIGAEYGVAIKNVIAVAAGCIAGLGYGDNTSAALITRGLAEMIRYGLKKGGKLETFMGLTGIGDLIVTCSSKFSRNYQAGYKIGKSNDVESFLKENTLTCEGIRTCKVVYLDATQNEDVDVPIIEAIYRVIYLQKNPKDEIARLMERELKVES